LGRFNAGGSSGGGFVSNVQLGDEQSVTAGLNERDFLLGGGSLIIARERVQLDAANPTHQFKVTHVQIIVTDNAPVATLVQVGIFGLDADVPILDLQKFYGESIPILPLQDTTMKIPIVSNDLISGDTFITPYYVANGNLNTRSANAAASLNSVIGHAVDTPWEKIDNQAWVATVFGGFFTIFFRRLVDQP